MPYLWEAWQKFVARVNDGLTTEQATRTPAQIVADAPDRKEALLRYICSVLESDGFKIRRDFEDVYLVLVEDAQEFPYWLGIDDAPLHGA